MAQRPFSPVTGQAFKVQNYFFQIILKRLIAKRWILDTNAQFIFTVFRETQKFQTTKPIKLRLQEAKQFSLGQSKLNFVAISYNPNRNLTFALRIVDVSPEKNKQIGQYLIDGNNFISRFCETQNGAFTLTVDFNEDWAADIELYVQKSRYGVERLINSIKHPKPKQQTPYEPISHQKIINQRKKLDLQELLNDQDTHRHQQYTKFSPRREPQEKLFRPPQNLNKNKQQPPIKQQIKRPQPPKKEEKKSNKQFVPKKEWIIPQAQKYLPKKKISNPISRKSSQKQQQKKQKIEEKKIRSERKQEKFQEQSPLKPKYIIIFIIFIVLALTGYQIYNFQSSKISNISQATAQTKKNKKSQKKLGKKGKK